MNIYEFFPSIYSFFPPLHRSFTSLTSYRANPSVKSQTKGSRPMRVRRRMNFFSSASKSRFVSSSWRFNQPLSLYFSSFFKGGVVQNYLQKLIIIWNIVSGRRIARIEWTEPETHGGEWAIQTGNFMIQLIDICCFDLFNNHIFPTGFHETMVGGSQTSRGVLVHKSEGVIDNIHLLNVAKYPKSWLLMNLRYHKIATTSYCWLTNFGTKLQNYYTEIINKTVIFDLPAF